VKTGLRGGNIFQFRLRTFWNVFLACGSISKHFLPFQIWNLWWSRTCESFS